MEPQYPDINVQLSGQDGNAFSIIGRVSAAMRRGGATREDVHTFEREAMSGDYDNVLRTCMKYVTVA